MPGRRALQMLRAGCGWENLQDLGTTVKHRAEVMTATHA
jgi:hypothetical protein